MDSDRTLCSAVSRPTRPVAGAGQAIFCLCTFPFGGKVRQHVGDSVAGILGDEACGVLDRSARAPSAVQHHAELGAAGIRHRQSIDVAVVMGKNSAVALVENVPGWGGLGLHESLSTPARGVVFG